MRGRANKREPHSQIVAHGVARRRGDSIDELQPAPPSPAASSSAAVGRAYLCACKKAAGAEEERANEEMAPRSLRLHAAHALWSLGVVVAQDVAHEGIHSAAHAAAGCRHLREAIQVNHMQRLRRLAFIATAAMDLL